MKKTQSLLLVLCLLSSWSWVGAQNASRFITPQSANHKVSAEEYINERMSMGDGAGKFTVTQPVTPANPQPNGPQLRTGATIQTVKVGTASNAYTILNDNCNVVFSNNQEGVVGWVYRNNIDEFPGVPERTANGVLRMSFSSDKGNNWTTERGPLNPLPYISGTGASIPGGLRYPQSVAYVGTGATLNDRLRVIWHAPVVDQTINEWGNYSRGVVKNVTSISSSQVNQQPTPAGSIKYGFLAGNQRNGNNVLIPTSLCQGRPGEFWTIDRSYSYDGGQEGTRDSVYLWKGTFVAPNTDSVAWRKAHVLRPPLYDNSGNGRPTIQEVSMEFAPDGLKGWVCILGDYAEGGNVCDQRFDIVPVMYKTVNGGDTWEGPIVVKLNEYDAIVDSLFTATAEEPTVNLAKGQPYPLSYDMTVDSEGNPHLFMLIGNGSDIRQQNGCPYDLNTATPGLDSLYYFLPGYARVLFDVTTSDLGNTWCPKYITHTRGYRNAIAGAGSEGAPFYYYTRPQASRSATGNEVFFSWLDDTTSTAEYERWNANLWSAGFRVTDGAVLPIKGISEGDPTFGGLIYYPAVAPVSLDVTGGFRIPTIFLRLLNRDTDPCEFYFIKNYDRQSSEFVTTQKHDIAIVEVSSPAENLCGANTATVTVKVKNVGTASIPSYSVSYKVNGGGGQNLNITAALAPNAEATHTFTTPENIAAGGTFVFDIIASAPHDNNCDNNIAQVTTVNFGGAANQIITSAEVGGASGNRRAACGTVTVDTHLPSLVHQWFDQDNNVIIGQSGSTYTMTLPNGATAPEDRQVYVEVTNPDCPAPGNVIRDTFFVRLNPSPVFDPALAARYEKCASDATPFNLQAHNPAAIGYTVDWRLKGATSSLAATNVYNPTASGIYTVKITNAQGCVDSRDVDVRIWDVASGLGDNLNNNNSTATSPIKRCVNGRLVLNAFNETQESGGNSIQYTWKVSKYNDINTDSTIYENQVGASSINALWDSIPVVRKYTVSIQALANGVTACGSPVTETVYVLVYDTLTSNKYSIVPASIFQNNTNYLDCVDDYTFTMIPTSRETKVTGYQWTITPPSVAQDITILEGSLGTAAGDGTRVIKLRLQRGISVTSTARVRARAFSGDCYRDSSFTFKALDSDSCVVSIDEELSSAVKFGVYPNPSEGLFNYNITAEKALEVNIVVYDAVGRAIIRREHNAVAEHNGTLDLSNQADGIYFMRVETPEGSTTRRLVKN